MERHVDLHIHTIYSDGVRTPAEIVAMAAAQGLRAVAIADHDSVSGIDEALAEGIARGIEVIPAVELSVEYKRFHDVHLLGYLFDHRDMDFRRTLEEFRKRRDNRGREIIARINARLAREKREAISYEEVQALSTEALGRPHIAWVLVAKGYAFDNEDAFRRYLEPCNVPKKYFPMAEAISEIRRLRGVAVLAHPQTITADRAVLRQLVAELASMGLGGIEVFNNMCYNDDMLFLEDLAGSLGLAMTGGSDYHGFEDDVRLGIGRGGLAVAYRWVEELKRRAALYSL